MLSAGGCAGIGSPGTSVEEAESVLCRWEMTVSTLPELEL